MYNAVLGLVDITRGTNSFYKLQLLESDSGKSYYLFRAWGRVGTTIGGNKLEASFIHSFVFDHETMNYSTGGVSSKYG